MCQYHKARMWDLNPGSLTPGPVLQVSDNRASVSLANTSLCPCLEGWISMSRTARSWTVHIKIIVDTAKLPSVKAYTSTRESFPYSSQIYKGFEFLFLFLRKISTELTSVPIFLQFIGGMHATAWLEERWVGPLSGSELVNSGPPKQNV